MTMGQSSIERPRRRLRQRKVDEEAVDERRLLVQQHRRLQQQQQQETPAVHIRLLPLPPAGGVSGLYDTAAVLTPDLLGASSFQFQQQQQQQAGAAPVLLFKYSAVLVVSLAAWLVYLVLPRGIRKAYCRAGRRRYSVGTSSIVGGSATTATRTTTTTSSSARQVQRQRAQNDADGYFLSPDRAALAHELSSANNNNNNNAMSDAAAPPSSTWQVDQSWFSTVGASSIGNGSMDSWQPSPEHPAVPHIPEHRILQETMHRLLNKGIRLTAHGVQTDPKRVWIRLHMSTAVSHVLSWQTEFPKQITDSAGHVSIVLFRGAMHKIDLAQVLYVDVGKKTSALLKSQAVQVPGIACFSLLTANGSLDLQTNSRLERDALVSCLSMILDHVHQTHEWRRLYEESTVIGSTTNTSMSVSNIGTDMFPTQTAAYF